MTAASRRVVKSIATLLAFIVILRFLPLIGAVIGRVFALVLRVPAGFLFILFVVLGVTLLWRKQMKSTPKVGEAYETKEYRNLP